MASTPSLASARLPMSKIYRVLLRYVHASREPVSLNYRQVPLDRSQARLVGREALTPDILLNDYMCNAVIDWITIDLRLKHVTQHQWLADAIEGFGRRPYIKPIDPGLGKESAHFTIKFQEPNIVQLRRIVAAIGRRYGLARGPSIVGMEVSIDFTPKTPSDDARARMVGVLFRHLAPTTDIFSNRAAMPRCSWGAGHRWQRIQESRGADYNVPYRFAVNDVSNVPAAHTTVYFGPKDDDVMWRVMDKVLVV